MFIRSIVFTAIVFINTVVSRAEVVFRGVFVISNANSACSNGPNVGDQGNGQFHPRGFGNSNFAALTTGGEFDGVSYRLDNGDFSTSYKKVITQTLGWSIFATPTQASVLFKTLPNITATTSSLTLLGKVKNPNGSTRESGCEVDFRAVMYKVIE